MFANTQTVPRSEMVKACVWPACTTWPGETCRSTTSPLMGASTGICAERRSLLKFIRVLDSEDLHSLLCRVEVGLSLIAIGLGLLEIALGDGLVLIEVLCTVVVFLCKPKGVLGFEIGVEQLCVVGAADFEHGLSGFDMLAGDHEDPADRAAYLGNDGRGVESVVGHAPVRRRVRFKLDG